ncbi:MAG: COG2426 family protein, partial [Candidatus Aminicenantales bacterium]
MLQDFVELLKEFELNRELIVLLVSMMPVFELRGAIPLAILHFDMPVASAFFLSWVGNLIPVLPIIYFLEPIRRALSRIKVFDRFFRWLYARTYRRSKNVMRLGAIGLCLFVAIPLPVTGAWTGSVVAILFDI